MRRLNDIYRDYKIPAGLQLHQIRVASVALYVAEYFGNTVDREKIILAGLFHDMGNIIKSEISLMPDLFEPEGVEYWEKVKSDFVEKYSNDEHVARDAIARDVGLSREIITLMGSGGFSNLESIVDRGSEELKIFQYGDSRVAPHGIMSVAERFREARERASLRTQRIRPLTHDDRFEFLLGKAVELELQLVSYAHFDPLQITDENLESLQRELSEYMVV